MDGLRARKKAQTRKEIASVAARLFRKRGYENVRMIDIAQAADVSEQTVYNYFPTKEHLIFDMDREFEARIVGVVRDRAPGISMGDAVREGALTFLDELSRSMGKKTGIPTSVLSGPALRRVWVELNARIADSLAEAIVNDAREAAPRAAAKILARSIVAVFAVILEEVGEAGLAGKKRKALLRELQPAIDRAVHGLQ